MKSKYDFSKAERGKFFKPDATLQLPVYLDPDVSKFINKLATEKKSIHSAWLTIGYAQI